MVRSVADDEAFEMVIAPRSRDLGDGFHVKRALPYARRRLVGPFVFFDQFGPTLLTNGHAMDVRPHPHIGLATVTYLFDGIIRHRDSLGTVADIVPGEVNWMTAGKGIVHSERTPPEVRGAESSLFGIQTWVALPMAHEETEPDFVHLGTKDLPEIQGDGVWMRVIAGTVHGAKSPLPTFSETIYADVQLDPGARFESPADQEERALYVVSGSLEVEGTDSPRMASGTLYVLRPDRAVTIRAVDGPARVMLVGGATMDGPRLIWWNFVSSSRDRIIAAADEWRNHRFPDVPDETEFIPLPKSDPPPTVDYP